MLYWIYKLATAADMPLSLLAGVCIITCGGCSASSDAQDLITTDDFIVIGASDAQAKQYFAVGNIVSIHGDSLTTYSILNHATATSYLRRDSSIEIEGNTYTLQDVAMVNPRKQGAAEKAVVYLDKIKPAGFSLKSMLGEDHSLTLSNEQEKVELSFPDFSPGKTYASGGSCLQAKTFDIGRNNRLVSDVRGARYGIYNRDGLVLAIPGDGTSEYRYYVFKSSPTGNAVAKLLHATSQVGYEAGRYQLNRSIDRTETRIDSTYSDLAYPILQDRVHKGTTTNYNNFRRNGGLYANELQSIAVTTRSGTMQLTVNDERLIDDTYRITAGGERILFDNQCEFNARTTNLSDQLYFALPVLLGNSLLEDEVRVSSSSASAAQIDNVRAGLISVNLRYVLVPLAEEVNSSIPMDGTLQREKPGEVYLLPHGLSGRSPYSTLPPE